VAGRLEELSKHFDTMGYDQHGLGQTSVPDGDYRMRDYAEDAAALLDVIGWQRCHVVGNSFGGMVAQELALRHPECIDRLVLACSSSGAEGGASYPLHEHLDEPPEDAVRAQQAIIDLRRDTAWQESHSEEWEKIVSDALALRLSNLGNPGFRRQILARAQHDTYSRLSQLKMPVFICGGRYDGQAPIENQHAMKRQIPHAFLEFFDGGHSFLGQDPRAMDRIVAFLNGKFGDPR
jgi:3-oxoadipate enol-lactonase